MSSRLRLPFQRLFIIIILPLPHNGENFLLPPCSGGWVWEEEEILVFLGKGTLCLSLHDVLVYSEQIKESQEEGTMKACGPMTCQGLKTRHF